MEKAKNSTPLKQKVIDNNYKRLVAIKALLDSRTISRTFDIRNEVGGSSHLHSFIKNHNIVKKEKLDGGGWKYVWNDSIPITMVLATRISRAVYDAQKKYDKDRPKEKVSSRDTNTAQRNLKRMRKIKELLESGEDISYKMMMSEVGGAAQMYMVMSEMGILEKSKGKRGCIFYSWNKEFEPTEELAMKVTLAQKKLSIQQEKQRQEKLANKSNDKEKDSQDDIPPINIPSKEDAERMLKDNEDLELEVEGKTYRLPKNVAEAMMRIIDSHTKLVEEKQERDKAYNNKVTIGGKSYFVEEDIFNYIEFLTKKCYELEKQLEDKNKPNPKSNSDKEENKTSSKDEGREINKGIMDYLEKQNDLSDRTKEILTICTSEPVIKELTEIIKKSYQRQRELTPIKKREISILWGAFRRTLKF